MEGSEVTLSHSEVWPPTKKGAEVPASLLYIIGLYL